MSSNTALAHGTGASPLAHAPSTKLHDSVLGRGRKPALADDDDDDDEEEEEEEEEDGKDEDEEEKDAVVDFWSAVRLPCFRMSRSRAAAAIQSPFRSIACSTAFRHSASGHNRRSSAANDETDDGEDEEEDDGDGAFAEDDGASCFLASSLAWLISRSSSIASSTAPASAHAATATR